MAFKLTEAYTELKARNDQHDRAIDQSINKVKLFGAESTKVQAMSTKMFLAIGAGAASAEGIISRVAIAVRGFGTEMGKAIIGQQSFQDAIENWSASLLGFRTNLQRVKEEMQGLAGAATAVEAGMEAIFGKDNPFPNVPGADQAIAAANALDAMAIKRRGLGAPKGIAENIGEFVAGDSAARTKRENDEIRYLQNRANEIRRNLALQNELAAKIQREREDDEEVRRGQEINAQIEDDRRRKALDGINKRIQANREEMRLRLEASQLAIREFLESRAAGQPTTTENRRTRSAFVGVEEMARRAQSAVGTHEKTMEQVAKETRDGIRFINQNGVTIKNIPSARVGR